ncbi:ABC transporter substrate-binding protein [Paenibacillus macerans]|uniref:ABC transporter substrate-binding protein n=1 Tax=Paenibacillus macerans TaxID=44252 RepID=UPI000563290C|nr:extracellular solute-binding protein [Paenibacillus macerans]MBS5911185.1 extracellular solute-binding protein [Paenibacillus macerans]MCY7562074.1 extracellular solute-binding protein [Paenibacillus macerans]MEC0153835.1 extracellular solute-binding protein [Paenibacillus macerans]SUA86336.1 family 1 extracellular solute-binding protein [Paenibacillus macerans]GBK66033.1 ABC transporter substrate-binding protein [Paenibacillus macerans]
MGNKKGWAALLLSALLIGLLAGCGGNSGGEAQGSQGAATDNAKASSSGETVKLTMWGGVPPEAGPQAVADAWNAEHPDIQVEYVRFVNDDDGNLKLDTALATGQAVDLFVNYSVTQAAKRVESGAALDLSSFTDYDIDGKMGPDAATWKIDGKYYGIPTKKNVQFFALNKDALDAAGLAVPKAWTWDEAREYAKKLKAAGFKYGLVQHTETFSDPMDSVMEKHGYIKEDGTSNMDDPLVRKWLETLNAMMKEDQTTPPLGEQLTSKMPVENMFLGGEAAMINIGEWLLRSSNNMKDFPRDFKIAFAPVPRLIENEEDFITSGGLGDFISINANSKHKEAAWEFLKWYADEGMLPMTAGGRLPASGAVDQAAAIESLLGEHADTYDQESLEFVLYGDQTPTFVRKLPQEMVDMRAQEYEKYFLGNQTAEQTVQAMVKRHNDFLKQNQ